VFHPGTLAEAIRSARAHQAVFQSHGGADINYNGASSDLEFLPYGFAQVPMMIWRAELSSTGPRFTTLARYKEGEANIPASCP
jgi:hypothetical protein